MPRVTVANMGPLLLGSHIKGKPSHKIVSDGKDQSEHYINIYPLT